MHETEEYEIAGTYEELARLVGCETNVVARCVIELQRTKTANVTNGHDEVTVMSRRMERELTGKEDNRLRKRKQRERDIVTPKSHDRVISKSKEKEIREEGNPVLAVAPELIIQQTESILGISLLLDDRRALTEGVPAHLFTEWISFTRSRMVGKEKGNGVKNKLGYWLTDFQKQFKKEYEQKPVERYPTVEEKIRQDAERQAAWKPTSPPVSGMQTT